MSVTPYDYYSVMHFDKNAFSNGSRATIITKNPEFQEVIGQLMEMSESDVIELNKLYKCSEYLVFCSDGNCFSWGRKGFSSFTDGSL